MAQLPEGITELLHHEKLPTPLVFVADLFFCLMQVFGEYAIVKHQSTCFVKKLTTLFGEVDACYVLFGISSWFYVFFF